MAFKIENRFHDDIVNVTANYLNQINPSELRPHENPGNLQNFCTVIQRRIASTLQLQLSHLSIKNAYFINGNLIIVTWRGYHFEIESHVWQEQRRLAKWIRDKLRSKDHTQDNNKPDENLIEIAEAS